MARNAAADPAMEAEGPRPAAAKLAVANTPTHVHIA